MVFTAQKQPITRLTLKNVAQYQKGMDILPALPDEIIKHDRFEQGYDKFQ